MKWVDRARQWAKGIKRDVFVLWLAAHDRRVPWYAKLAAGAVAAYALSPVDLIPDFIPVLGYLDDLVIVPLGIIAVIRLIPDDVLAHLRIEAAKRTERPVSWGGLIAIVAIWVLLAALIVWMAIGGTAAR
ncbi:YkvA family protein [Sinorhizobium chiapasense]|uniref:YkvA family protein n=1 Tax=Sinorhizobium chiapasense TaxID=501572 RepID=A0ABZ2B405_9HYPH